MLLLLAGCAAPGPPPALPEPEPVAVVPDPPPPPAPTEPVATPPRTPAPERTRADIAVVLDADTPAHVAVADEIVAALSPRLYRVARITTTDTATLDSLRSQAVTIVAVGAEAVRVARAALPSKPLVFCQVPDAADALQGGGPTWGVESLPPLTLQLKSWQAVDPSLRTIALIVSASGATLAEEARRAARIPAASASSRAPAAPASTTRRAVATGTDVPSACSRSAIRRSTRRRRRCRAGGVAVHRRAGVLVAPVVTRACCASRSAHGAARGR